MSERPETVLRPIRVRGRLPTDLDDAFAFVSDPCNDPLWVDTTPKVEQEVGDGPAVGAIYRYHQTVGRPVDGSIEITEMDGPTWMAFRVQDPLRDYRIEYRLRPHPKGGVVLEQTSHPRLFIHLGWKKWFVPFYTKKQLRKQMRALAEALA